MLNQRKSFASWMGALIVPYWHTNLHPMDLWADPAQLSTEITTISFMQDTPKETSVAFLAPPRQFCTDTKNSHSSQGFSQAAVNIFSWKLQIILVAGRLDTSSAAWWWCKEFLSFVFPSLSEQQIFTTMSSWAGVKFPTENWASAAATRFKVRWDKDEDRTWIFWFPLLCALNSRPQCCCHHLWGRAFQSWRLSKASSFSKH